MLTGICQLIVKINKTFPLDIIRLIDSERKKNVKPYYSIQKGSIIEVNVSSLGFITQKGVFINRILAKVTNKPFLDGCVNSVAFKHFDI